MLRNCEAKISALRSDELSGQKIYKLVSVREMASVYNFSPRKIEAIISKGVAHPDEDAPEVAEETRYWVLVQQQRTDSSTVR